MSDKRRVQQTLSPSTVVIHEPCFLLSATDPLSADLVDEWANRAEQQGAAAHIVLAARTKAQEMRDFKYRGH